MSRHTVGPWQYDPEGGDVIAPKCGYQWAKGVCVVANVKALDYGEGTGNGALIAAAPDLLEALILLREEMKLSGNAGSKDYGWPKAILATDAAIAKATGEQA